MEQSDLSSLCCRILELDAQATSLRGDEWQKYCAEARTAAPQLARALMETIEAHDKLEYETTALRLECGNVNSELKRLTRERAMFYEDTLSLRKQRDTIEQERDSLRAEVQRLRKALSDARGCMCAVLTVSGTEDDKRQWLRRGIDETRIALENSK